MDHDVAAVWPWQLGRPVPIVYHGPYEYSSPLTEEDYLPQNVELTGKAAVAR